MNVIIIPKNLRNKELVIIAKDEYEAMKSGVSRRIFKEVAMTKEQKKALMRARKNFARGNTLTLDEFRQKLGITD